MAKNVLPLIPRKYIKRNGKVDLWDVLIENGPARFEFTAILAREALQRDPDRFKFELPKGTKQGSLQDEADEREQENMEEGDRIDDADPHFGKRKQQ